MKQLLMVTAVACVAGVPLTVYAQTVDDPFSDYAQRSDTILFGAGNAPEANAAIHTTTPWPPYVGDTRIRIDGRRSVDAVEQMHRVPDPFARQGVETSVGNTGAGTPTSTGSAGNGSPGPVQPVSNAD